jgi:hypothetical protein
MHGQGHRSNWATVWSADHPITSTTPARSRWFHILHEMKVQHRHSNLHVEHCNGCAKAFTVRYPFVRAARSPKGICGHHLQASVPKTSAS